MRRGQSPLFLCALLTCSSDPRAGASVSSSPAGLTLPPQTRQRPRQEVKATRRVTLPGSSAHPHPQPLTSRDRTLLGSSSSRVKMSPRFTVSWDPSSNSTCQGDTVQLAGCSAWLAEARHPHSHGLLARQATGSSTGSAAIIFLAGIRVVSRQRFHPFQ